MRRRPRDADLVIVGAGPAGCATALFAVATDSALRRRIVVLDRHRFPRDKVCAGAVGARAERLLGAIGVRLDVPGVSLRGLAVTTAKGRQRARLPPNQLIGRVVRRARFDAALLEAVRERDIAVRTGVKVEGLARDADGIELRTTTGRLRARAAVGADGIGSAVRRSLGLPRGRYFARAAEMVEPAVPGDPDRDLLHFDLTDPSLCGYGWTFPTLLDDRPAWSRGWFELSREHPRARRLSGTHRSGSRFYAERGLCLDEPCASSRVLLVGEAAGIDPVLGEGIAPSIACGAVAGPYLAGCLDRDRLDFRDWRTVLSRSAVGRDLRRRAAALPWLYGTSRPWATGFVGRSRALAVVGAHYFAGLPIPPAALLGAGAALLGAAAGAGLRSR